MLDACDCCGLMEAGGPGSRRAETLANALVEGEDAARAMLAMFADQSVVSEKQVPNTWELLGAHGARS